MRGTIIRGLEAKNGEYLITSERGEALKKMGADATRSSSIKILSNFAIIILQETV